MCYLFVKLSRFLKDSIFQKIIMARCSRDVLDSVILWFIGKKCQDSRMAIQVSATN